MADKKISALTAATTPLAGTEVLPIVQDGVTVKVAVSDLTAGRAVSATQVTLSTGNLIVANGQGVDFSATPGTGTSELLADYEEGIWTPTYVSSGATFGYTQQFGSYVKIGNLVYAQFYLNVTASGTTTNQVTISGLPFTNTTVNAPYEQGFGGAWSSNVQPIAFTVDYNATTITIWKQNISPTVAIALNVVGYQVGTFIYRSA
jgi:hypothetical protein